MRIKIAKTARNNGVPQAFVVKIKGLKFPRGFKDWYFVSSKEKALELALIDWRIYKLKKKANE